MKKLVIKRGAFYAFVITPFLIFALIRQTNRSTALPNGTTLKATLKGAAEPLPLYGFNGNNIKGPSWEDKSFRDSAASLKFRIIRYPGGTIGEYWDWRKGWFVDKDAGRSIGLEIPPGYLTMKYSPTGLKELKLLVDKTNCEVVFDLNMTTKDLDDQIEMLKNAQSLGIQVKWVELGNEYNLPKSPGRKKFRSATEYGQACNKWAAAIKESFQGVRIAVIGGNEQYSPDVRDWNNTVLKEAPNVDAIVAHIYPIPKTILDSDGINFENLYDSFTKSYEKQGFENIDSRVWVTEYNIHWAAIDPGENRADIQKYAQTWGQALSTILMTSLATTLPKKAPEMVLDHNISNWSGFAAIETDKKTLNILANGIGFGAWCEAASNKTSLTKIDFGNHVKDFEVLGWQFSSGAESTDLFVNFTSSSVKVNIADINSNSKDTYHLRYADKNKIIQNWRDFTHETKQVRNGEIDLPPYSIVRL